MTSAITSSASRTVTDTITQAFAWMFAGLSLTGVTSYAIASNQAVASALLQNQLLFFGIIIVELALVFFLSFRIMKLSFTTALVAFLAYAFLNGVTLFSIFYIYTASSITSTFFISAAVFGVMALYGYTTKSDLTSMGSLALMGLIGIIIASVVNMFLKNNTVSFVVSYLAVFIFIGLTAYDTQKLKKMAAEVSSQNVAILGALTLYLDFINLFINLLRIMGKRR